MSVKIGMVQIKSHRTNEAGIRSVSGILERLGRNEADVVCLPEQWLHENRINDFDAEFDKFKKIAKEYGMTIIAGAFYHKSRYGYAISAPVIGPSGEIIGLQGKIHPFGYERDLISSETTTRIFRTKCRFGILICYDMVFPDVAESLVKKGAQVLLSPSRIVRQGILPWHMYVQVRALENRIPIIAANMQNRRFGGKSIMVDLVERGDIVVPKTATLDGQSSKLGTFDLARYEKARKTRYSDHRKFV